MEPEYDERLGVPGWWWLGGAVLAAVAGGEAYLGMALWLDLLTIGAIVVIAGGMLLFAGAARVTVEAGALVAGRARLPLEYAGEITVLDRPALRQLLGPRADPAAYVLVRSWVPGGIRMQIVDPADPTPYWLVSSRRPKALAAAIAAARRPV